MPFLITGTELLHWRMLVIEAMRTMFVTDTFQGHLQVTKVFLKLCDVNLFIILKSYVQPLR